MLAIIAFIYIYVKLSFMLTKIYKNITLFIVFLIPFIPLYVANNLFFPFITGKAFLFRILVELAFALWLMLILRDKSYAPRFSPLLLSITVFTVIVFIADLMGMNAIRSLWSNFERMEGWVTIIHLWAYFLVLTGMFNSYNNYSSNSSSNLSLGKDGKFQNENSMRMWHWFLNMNIIIAVIIAIYGLVQLSGNAAIHQGGVRLDASLGNAIYLAVYMLFQTFFAVYMFFIAKAKKIAGYSVLVWVYPILAILFTFILFETATRGTILALIGGVMLSLFLYSVFGKGESKKWRLISGGAILVIILIGVIFWMNRDAKFIQNNAVLGRLASISLSDTKTQARGYIWPMAIDGVFDSTKTAVIGLGQENFNYIFNEKYNPNMWGHEQWFDRAHNVYLDWLVAGGILALLAYLSLYVLAIISIWKSNMGIKSKSIFTGLIVGYAIHNVFVFDNLASYILFFTTLGFIHSMRENRPIKWLEINENRTEEQIIVRDYVFVPVIILLFLTCIYLINVRPIQSNTRLAMALGQCSGGQPNAESYSKALKLDQYVANQEIREQLISCAGNVIRGNYSDDIKNNFYLITKQEIENQIKDTPNDTRIYMIGATFFDGIGDYQTGKPLIEKAYELSPTKQTVMFELVQNYLNIGKEKEALDIIKKAYESAMDNRTAKIIYISILILNGQENKAIELFGKEKDLFIEPMIINTYFKMKNYKKVVDIYKELIVKEPNNLQYYSALVTAHLYNKQTFTAISTLQSMKDKFPQAKAEIEAAIKQIQEGKVNLPE